MGQYFTLAFLRFLLGNALTNVVPVTFTGQLTNGSTTVSSLSSQAGLAVGQQITGVGIPGGATIAAVNVGANTLTLSVAATATTASGATTFMTAVGNVLQSLGLTIHLLTGAVPQGDNMTWNQVTEANYDGYLPQAAIGPWVVANYDGEYVFASCQAMTFQPSDYLVPNTITGWALTYTLPGASGPTLGVTEQFATPQNLSDAGDLVRFIPCLTVDPNQLGKVPSPVV